MDIVITINLRNEFLWSELYGNVVLEICVSPLVKINIWHYSPLLIMLIMLVMLIKKLPKVAVWATKLNLFIDPLGT